MWGIEVSVCLIFCCKILFWVLIKWACFCTTFSIIWNIRVVHSHFLWSLLPSILLLIVNLRTYDSKVRPVCSCCRVIEFACAISFSASPSSHERSGDACEAMCTGLGGGGACSVTFYWSWSSVWWNILLQTREAQIVVCFCLFVFLVLGISSEAVQCSAAICSFKVADKTLLLSSEQLHWFWTLKVQRKKTVFFSFDLFLNITKYLCLI